MRTSYLALVLKSAPEGAMLSCLDLSIAQLGEGQRAIDVTEDNSWPLSGGRHSSVVVQLPNSASAA